MKKIKVALAEDHAQFRGAFLRLMKSESDIEFVVEAENGEDLLKKIEKKWVDVVIMDINMPVLDGIETTKRVIKKYPHIKVIAFTQFSEERYIIEMCKIGIKSFIDKNQSSEVPKAIRTVIDGGVYYPDQIAKAFSKYLSEITSECPFELSKAELSLVRNLCDGLSSTKIAELISKSPRTVEKYRAALYRKFEVNSKEQLIVKAMKWALLN